MTSRNDYQPAERRPLASRSLGWVQAIARWLVRRGLSANAISVSSTLFALAGAAALLATIDAAGTTERAFWVLAAAFVQLRLLANLLDGIVALASGAASSVGELFNEVPDRISDVVLLVPLGFVADSNVHLAYLAAILALLVAYVRAVGASVGAGQVFAGVMAKPQRMFCITMLCLYQALAPTAWRVPLLDTGLAAPDLVLAVVCLGCLVTCFTRLRTISRTLRGSA